MVHGSQGSASGGSELWDLVSRILGFGVCFEEISLPF